MAPGTVLVFWIYSSVFFCINSATSGTQACSFPEKWRGTWFQNGLGDVEIRTHSISHLGYCRSFDGHNKYLLFNRQDICFICLAFTPQHHNLLQYKQSFCALSDRMQEVCEMITGDFPLNTMVKVPGSPIPCPFQGHYSFWYTNGSEVKCDNPLSSIQACADSSRFLFQHRKCQLASNTNDKIESFQCLAIWHTGMDHYLYGRFTGPHLTTKESQYRCFMYTLYGPNSVMSMTADATCQGLQSSTVGMNLYNLIHKYEEWPQPGCQFPEFFSSISQWRDVNSRLQFSVSVRRDGFNVTDILDPYVIINDSDVRLETRLKVTCIGGADSTGNGHRKMAEMLVYVTDDKCESTYRCIRFTQRTDKVVELQIGQPTEQTEYACQSPLFQGVKKQVLIPWDSPPKPCPLPGVYNYVQRTSQCKGQLDIGCWRASEIVIDGRCPGGESADVLQCYYNWTESDRIYVIAGRVGDLRKAADCLVCKVTASGYELEADPTCGNERLHVLGRPVEFVINSPSKLCSATTSRPAVYPAQSQESRDQTGIYDTNPSKGVHAGEIIETHSSGRGTQKTSGVINADNKSQSVLPESLLVCAAVLLCVLHSHR
ncbi:hypothetical protein BsWGS_02571 [Bradybaena similaris]